MPDERTCRTCWHWGVIGLCGHPDTGGAVHGADDTCCNHLAIVGRGGDWQPYEQLSGGSSPAENWREPMVDASNSSNPPEERVGRHLQSGLTHGRLDAMAERDLLKQRVAELEAELENERRRVAELSRDNWNLHEALSVAEAEMQPTEVCPACNGDVPWGKPGICYLCGNMGVVTKERLLRIDAFRQCEAANKRLRQVRRWAAAWKRAAKSDE